MSMHDDRYQIGEDSNATKMRHGHRSSHTHTRIGDDEDWEEEQLLAHGHIHRMSQAEAHGELAAEEEYEQYLYEQEHGLPHHDAEHGPPHGWVEPLGVVHGESEWRGLFLRSVWLSVRLPLAVCLRPQTQRATCGSSVD